MIDVDAMLDAFTPAEFDERLAAHRIEQEGPAWFERLMACLKLSAAASCWSTKDINPDDFDPLRPRVDEPPMNPYQSSETITRAHPAEPQMVSPNQAAALFGTVFGQPNTKR